MIDFVQLTDGYRFNTGTLLSVTLRARGDFRKGEPDVSLKVRTEATTATVTLPIRAVSKVLPDLAKFAAGRVRIPSLSVEIDAEEFIIKCEAAGVLVAAEKFQGAIIRPMPVRV